jgi:glyoxylase-like metal-dependent hydrolase (beta-lactamase superfamily II)
MVQEFFHRPTGTLTYVVAKGEDAVIIDPCLDFDLSEMKVSRESLNTVIEFVRGRRLNVHWILETHVHADHVTGSAVLKREFPSAKVAIGEGVRDVQKAFWEMFSLNIDRPLGWPFDRLLKDGETVEAGALRLQLIATPGHTPACMSIVTDEGVFTGDSLFMPKAGTGRCDFPGGDARTLFESIQRLYWLHDELPVYVGHDYPVADQAPTFKSTILEEKQNNAHVKSSTKLEEFVDFRRARDGKLSIPRLFYPSLYINMLGGQLPEKDSQGRRMISFPLSDSL